MCNEGLFVAITMKIPHSSLPLFAAQLGISSVDLQQIESQHAGDYKSKVYGLLCQWKQQNGRNATYNNLADVYLRMENQEAFEFIYHYREENEIPTS